jgi:multidrug efflux pump subunit AcrA (membrane-fusion protein)
VVAPGQWKAAAEVVVTTPFPAVLEALGPKVGDRVVKGTVIGSLSTRESRAALRGAELMSHQATDAASRSEAERGLDLARREQVRVPVVAPTSGTVVRRAAELVGAEVA